FAAEIREALDAAVEWLVRRLAADELGLLSFQRANPDGLENQVWKDSWDSMSHTDGTVCNHDAPVASVEAQALAYDALLDVGRHGFPDEAQELQRRLLAMCRATHRFPEFVAGGDPGSELIAKRIVDVYDSVNDRMNRVEQPPQELQAWTVGSVVAIENG